MRRTMMLAAGLAVLMIASAAAAGTWNISWRYRKDANWYEVTDIRYVEACDTNCKRYAVCGGAPEDVDEIRMTIGTDDDDGYFYRHWNVWEPDSGWLLDCQYDGYSINLVTGDYLYHCDQNYLFKNEDYDYGDYLMKVWYRYSEGETLYQRQFFTTTCPE